jgi:predicted NBD/HSP70 family sugar kinase
MYLVIDIGGTKTLAGVFSADGDLVKSEKIQTPKNYKEFLKELEDTVKKLTTQKEILKGCCVAVPGLVDRKEGVIHALGNLDWHEVKIRHDLSKFLDQTPILIENDARLAGLAEANVIRYSHQNVLYLTVSTGIGGALIKDGKIVESLQDTEMGKMPLLYEGRIENWEEFASGRWVVKTFGKKAQDITDDKEWDQLGHNVAIGVAVACSVLQPEAIIFGGGVGQYADKFSDVVSDYLIKYLHPVVRRPQALLAASFPDDAVIRGGYLLLKQKKA